MQQIKIFVDIESNFEGLEERINAWLAENASCRIVNVFGNVAPQTHTVSTSSSGTLQGSKFASSDLMYTVVYEKS